MYGRRGFGGGKSYLSFERNMVQSSTTTAAPYLMPEVDGELDRVRFVQQTWFWAIALARNESTI